MNPLLEPLRHWLGKRRATVVHLGAGSGAVLDAYAGLPCARLVLVEGDPDHAGALAARAAPLAGVEVHNCVLSAEPGHVLWNRYNLRALNGPLDAGGLRSVYPRLQTLSTLPLASTGLAAWLAALELGTPEGPRVLVFDFPGQEAALLAALDDETLWRFDAILLRGCGRPPGDGWAADGTAPAALAARWFRAEPAPDPQDALWPVHFCVQDLDGRTRAAAERERQALAESMERLRLAGEDAERARDAATAEVARQAARVEELQAQLETLGHDRDRESRQHQEHVQWARDLEAQVQTLTAERDALRSAQEAMLAERDAGLADRDAARIDELSAQVETLTAERDALRSAQEAMRAERDAGQAEREAAHAAERTRDAARIDELSAQAETLRRERDQEAHWHQEHAQWSRALDAEKSQLAEERDQLRQALLSAQEAAAAQEREARERERLLHEELSTTRRARDEQAHWHQENAKWAQGLKAEIETLNARLADGEVARQAMADKMAERDARQRQLDAEILRAEAQLDLIKDVLIREKNF